MSLQSVGVEPASQTHVIPVPDETHVGEARRAVRAISAQLHLDETAAGRVSVVVTELATNLARHGRGGRLLVRAIARQTGIEVVAIDAGPGIPDIDRAMRDGFSTFGSAGKGLGAVRRMSDEFDAYSRPPAGTVILSRMLRLGPGDAPPDAMEVGAVCVPAPNEHLSGDSWAMLEGERGPAIAVIDGLGHGPDANAAAVRGIEALRANPRRSPAALIEVMHVAMRGTRGAAAAVAEIDEGARTLRFAGIGNIACSVTDNAGSHSMASMSGIVGLEMYKVQEFSGTFAAGALLLMHSDGIATRWRLDSFPGIRPRHPAIAAALLFRDYLRGRDDATMVVARSRSAGSPAVSA